MAGQDEEPRDRVSHFDRTAEQYVLGAMMLDSRRVWDVLDTVEPADFHDPSHELIAEAIKRLASRQSGTDALLVEDELRAMGAKIPQGPAYVYELQSGVPTAENADYYAGIVKRFAVRRGVAVAGQRVQRLATDDALSSDELVENARAAVDAVQSSATQRVVSVTEEIEATLRAKLEPPVGVPTPWREVNDIIFGLKPGRLYIVAARPAVGKSVMGINLALELAKHGGVALISLEMGREEIHDRMVAQLGKVNVTRLTNSQIEDEDWSRIREARAELSRRSPIYISDTPGQTIAQIRSFVRSVAREGKLSGVVLDYLQLTEPADPRKDRQAHIAEVSRATKVLAKEYDVPVIVLSQVNRKAEERMDGRPRLSDLRESGAIEQDADVVMLMHRDSDRVGEVDVIVAKQRGGKTAEATMAWLGHYAAIEDMGDPFDG